MTTGHVTSRPLTFGIYPLGVAGTPTGLAAGPPDDYEKIGAALHELGTGAGPLPARTYAIYTGPESAAGALDLVARYLDNGVLGHLTIGCLQEPNLDLVPWLDFVTEVVARYGSYLLSLQVTNEPNLSFMEGSRPYVLEALVHGVIAAKRETEVRNLAVPVGFGSVPEGPASLARFWEDLGRIGDTRFRAAVDFVGHNFYVDVFEAPVPHSEIPVSIVRTLRHLRVQSLPAAGLSDRIPIRVTENGWPTGKNPFTGTERTYDEQALVFDTMIRTVHRLRVDLNITHYQLFGLRDADSTKDDLFHQFGILRHDYTPKPAYHTFRKLVHELV